METKSVVGLSAEARSEPGEAMHDGPREKDVAANISAHADPAIKYESPYSTAPPEYDVHQANLKRRASDVADEMWENDGKRQRIEVPATNDEFDLASIIAQATATAERTFVESALQGSQPYGNHTNDLRASNNGFSSDPQLYMRILSLPMLESLSTQILSTLAQGPYSETIKIITQPDSELGQAYATLKSLFDQTKKIYSQQKPFLSADELSISEPAHRATIRTTNLATFVSSVFGGQDVGFYELNDHFIQTFVPDGEALPKEPGMLYLNLKTQMYLSAISQEEQDLTKEEILDDLFPLDLEARLIARHPGIALLSDEIEFLEEAKARRSYLQNETSDVDSISMLSEKYAWEDFLKNLNAHLKKAYEPLIAPYMRRHALTAPPVNGQGISGVNPQIDQPIDHTEDGELDEFDIIEQATRAATQAALQSVGYGTYGGQAQNGDPNTDVSGENNGYGTQYSTGAVPYHTQSAPTQVLYEQARQAAVAKASPHSRRPGLPSQRRPWSTEEENALMAGLDQVKGPHWSQILALYGAKGQVSEILKDRNQVQLKDKARNLKLFFLKSNIEVPYYLQCVTGELKTRAPSQAARKEAEERARLAGDEEQARFDGIMALANGMQQPQSAHPQSNHSGTSREHSQESLRVTDDAIKVEPESEEEARVSLENSSDARLEEDVEGQESPAEAPAIS